jgi:hypothetical protein
VAYALGVDVFLGWFSALGGRKGRRKGSTHHTSEELVEIIMGHLVTNTHVGG